MSYTAMQQVTYYNGHVIEVNGRRYVPKRTCRMVKPEWAGPKSRTKVCSECGVQFQTWLERFCSHCGAEVVD